MESRQPNLAQFFELPNPGLRAYFQRTVTGNSEDYRPPFWKGESRESVIAKWQKKIDQLGVKEKWPTLYDYEMEMKGKIGPMSLQQPLKDRIDSIEAYYTRSVLGKSVAIPDEAVKQTIDYFAGAKGIRLRSQARVVENMRLSTNSGNPWFTKRRRVVQSALDSVIYREGDRFMCKVKGKEYELAAVLGWRGQEGGIEADDVKQRVIWMMSFLLNIYELQAYQPLIEAIQKSKSIPAYVSMEEVDRRVTALFDSKGADDIVICTDFTKFDQSFNPVMQDCAKKVYQGLFTPNPDFHWWIENVYPAKFNIPLICSEDLAFFGPHGMGSGSGGTNADECMAHRALQYDACNQCGTHLNPNSMAYGDDGILSAPGLTVADVIRAYESHGMEMNPEKQYVSKHDCVVLRRWHHVDYRVNGIMVGVYSTFRALGRLLAQERYYDPEEWGPDQVTLRAWSILENCNNSPYFEEFVRFAMAGDKYRLGLDLPGFFDNLDRIVKKSMSNLPDFLGYTKTLQSKDGKSVGIKGWRIYRYLSSLR